MLRPTSFGKKLDDYKSEEPKIHLSTLFSGQTYYVTSDAYGIEHCTDECSMKLQSAQSPASLNSMDFLPFTGCVDESEKESQKSRGCGSGLWHFVQFDSNPLPQPKAKRKLPSVPFKIPFGIRSRSSSNALSTPPLPPPTPFPSSKLKRVVSLRLPTSSRNRFRVGDDEDETQIFSETPKNERNKAKKRYQSAKKVKNTIKSIINTPRSSNRTTFSNLVVASNLSTSATESLSGSDDDDSMWNDFKPLNTSKTNLSVKYSKRSEVSNGSTPQPTTDMARRALRPNSTHVNSSYWSEKNQRPYMEDRILLDRIGSTLAIPNSSETGWLGMSTLIEKLSTVSELVGNGVSDSNSEPFQQEPISVFGTFDGHAGALASQYCSDWISLYIRRQKSFHIDLPQTLRSTFKAIDKDFLCTGNEDGTTACVCIVVGDKRVVCANAGDSRAIIVKKDGSFVCLSRDHKPGSVEETRRIHELGGKVTYNGRWRVEGRLAVSRAIGDLSLKPYVSSDPDISDYTLKPDDWFMVIATDGIFDVLENDQVATMTLSYSCKVRDGSLAVDVTNLKCTAKRICERAKHLGSNDNLSAIVVDLQN